MTAAPGLVRYGFSALVCWDNLDHTAAAEFEVSGTLSAVPGPGGVPSDADVRAILNAKLVPPDGYTGPPSVRGWTLTGEPS